MVKLLIKFNPYFVTVVKRLAHHSYNTMCIFHDCEKNENCKQIKLYTMSYDLSSLVWNPSCTTNLCIDSFPVRLSLDAAMGHQANAQPSRFLVSGPN